MLDLAILGLLHEQELHGYEIRRRLRDELGLFANISFGSLYPALSRLEKAQAVTVIESSGAPTRVIPPTGSLSGERAGLRARRSGTPRGSRRSRKVYRITDRGRALFEQLLDAEEPSATDDARSFGLRLAFARYLAPSARLALLERRRSQLVRRLATDRRRADDPGLDVYTRSLVEHSSESTAHDIAWLDRLIEFERQRQATGRPPRADGRDPRNGEALITTEGTHP
ncbi:MAG TPA: PadR family transcriptional regulator [Acidimicrobiales bacterium]|nr:PadR family transcriptional regulator [Acidimicrobiales bacterium]